MPRPAVLLVDPEVSRRKDLAHGLSGFGYEVIPAVDEQEGRRFAAGLGPGVVVAPAELARSGGPVTERFAGIPGEGAASRHTLLLLGKGEEDGRDLPEEVLFLQANGFPPSDLVRRIHLVLLGREIGLEPDAGLDSLVGDLSLVSLFELLRDLQRARASARVVCAEGEVTFEEGEVISATAGHARGLKAFFRLGSLSAGPFWVQLRDPRQSQAGRREIQEDLKALIIRALEEQVHDAPDPRTRVRIEMGPSFFDTRFNPRQQELLAALPSCPTVGRLLDALPASDGEILRDLLELRELGLLRLEEPQDLVRVVTDSTSDLPPELARAHGIHVVPLLVLFGDRVYHDGVDLRPRELYEQLEKGEVHPKTNPPLQRDFLEAYGGLAGRKDLISVHLSGKLSQTLEHARAAVAEGLPSFQDARGPAERVTIKVVDSGNVSLGLGMMALFAARMARRGVEPDVIAERLEAMRGRMHVLFAVDSLDYLARGGRIGKGRALMGNLLGIKPILGVVDGEVVSLDKVRGGRAAQPRLVELFRQRVDPSRPVMASIAHAKAPVWADRLRGLLQQSFQTVELIVAEMGPVVGTHAGPGTVGACLFQPTDEELTLIAPLPETL
ncbi:MAG TPA: DegV family protein [Thermoanaerobaculia bacterium]|nr:DegV family protein [Thermoanaerobaculia bacterium]